MTADERETLAGIAVNEDARAKRCPPDIYGENERVTAGRNAAAIRAALAEIDRLRAEVADMRSRAIPKAWVNAPNVTIIADLSDDSEARITLRVTSRSAGWAFSRRVADANGDAERIDWFDTLAAALAAADKESP